MRACLCGCIHIENRDTGKCATCNKIDRDARKPVAVKERKPIAKISVKRTAALAVRAGAYREVKKVQTCCAACNSRQLLTPSHVLSQAHFKQHISNPLNIVVLCQRCHNLWEDNKTIFRDLWPEVWHLKMRIMEALEPAYYLQFISKHGT